MENLLLCGLSTAECRNSVICDQKKNKLCLSCPPQFVEAISNKQTELDNYIAEGYKNALSEERRRYCFLVDRQCAVAKNSSSYHSKVGTVDGDPVCAGWMLSWTVEQ